MKSVDRVKFAIIFPKKMKSEKVSQKSLKYSFKYMRSCSKIEMRSTFIYIHTHQQSYQVSLLNTVEVALIKKQNNK